MRNGYFILDVIPSRSTQVPGTLRLANGENFMVRMGNTSERPGVAILTVQGVKIGAIRLPARRVDVNLEGPTHSTALFKFDATRRGIEPNIVKATFYLGDMPLVEAPCNAPTQIRVDRFLLPNGQIVSGVMMVAPPAPVEEVQRLRTNLHPRVYRSVKPIRKDMGTKTDMFLAMVWESHLDVSVAPPWNSVIWPS